MNRKLVLGLILLAVLVLSGCGRRIATKQPSELVLDLSDLGKGYSIKESTPRLKTDVDPAGIELGWISGHYTMYARIGENIFDVTVIEQGISVYPIESISKVLLVPQEANDEIIEELPSPNIGDKSRAFRITQANSFVETRYYVIEFIKMNIYESLIMSGTATNYESLQDIAKKAIAKVK